MWEPIADAPGDVLALCDGPSDSALIGTQVGLYRSVGGGEWTQLLHRAAQRIGYRDGTIIAGGGRGACYSEDGGASWHEPELEPVEDGSFAVGSTTAVATGPDGALWAAFAYASLTMYPVDVGGPTPMLHGAHVNRYALCHSTDRAAWRTRSKQRTNALAFAGDQLVIGSEGGLELGGKTYVGRAVSCIAVEQSGRIVAGTRGSAYTSRKPGEFIAIGTTYRDETGVTNDCGHFSAMVRGPSGRVFAAARGLGLAGVFMLDDGRKLRWLGKNAGLLFAPDGMRSGIEITALAITSDGTGWAATARHGLFLRSGLDSS